MTIHVRLNCHTIDDLLSVGVNISAWRFSSSIRAFNSIVTPARGSSWAWLPWREGRPSSIHASVESRFVGTTIVCWVIEGELRANLSWSEACDGDGIDDGSISVFSNSSEGKGGASNSSSESVRLRDVVHVGNWMLSEWSNVEGVGLSSRSRSSEIHVFVKISSFWISR